jgi:transcriptional regulator with XRE-family HTH domain
MSGRMSKRTALVTRDRDRPVNRQGAASTGLYPQVSRTKLAKALGMDTSTVSGYLAGRTPLRLRDALRVAELVGVGVEELNEALGKAQVEYAERRVARARDKARKMKARIDRREL